MAFDREIVALTLFCEASGATLFERRAIAHCIKNRALAGTFGGSAPAQVCLKRMQFSEWNGDPVDNQNLLRGAGTAETNPIMQDCLAAYSEVFLNGAFDPTGGATHFCEKIGVQPSWALSPGARVALSTTSFNFYSGVA